MQAQNVNPPVTLLDQMTLLRDSVDAQLLDILNQYGDNTEVLKDNLSAINLAHYLALRRHDLRLLQQDLTEAGASSLGHCESNVMASLNRVIMLLQHGYKALCNKEPANYPDYSDGRDVLNCNAKRLFGPTESQRYTRIMVTLPSHAAWDEKLVNELIANGMNCARINCAHDDEEAWGAMIENVIWARKINNKECTILMDLAGQKIRTQLAGNIKRQIKLNPLQLDGGTEPAQILLGCGSDPVHTQLHNGFQAYLGLPKEVFSSVAYGDQLVFVDAKGKKRKITISARSECGNWIGLCGEKTRLNPDISYKWRRKQKSGKETLGTFKVDYFPEMPSEIRLMKGDPLFMPRGELKDEKLFSNEHPQLICQIGCTHPQVIDNLSLGDWVWFDDGKVGALIERIDEQGAWLKVHHAGPDGSKLRSDKSINFPDSCLTLPCLTEKDLQDLDFIAKHADMVGFSFVQSRADMCQLMAELTERDAKHISIIAKIETKVAVRNLPEIILAAINDFHLGVMIARGDLAVELGGERMAEIQEELLWICEAAHVPVIWATQVLESLAKKGLSTRAELTDAAMSGRAECVMLNKGDYILQAVHTLYAILSHMQDHQYKKGVRMRALHW